MKAFQEKFETEFTLFQVLHEESDYKNNIITKATMSGMVTLIGRTFARGSDFSCTDTKTISSGGPHVIQVFLSSSEAEGTQAAGRTARQGEPGSYELILWEEDLINLGFEKAQIDKAVADGNLYQVLKAGRDKNYSDSVQGLIDGEVKAQPLHKLTLDFHTALSNYSPDPAKNAEIEKFILELNMDNIAQSSSSSKYHIYFCLDDSGSMSPHWNSLMDAVRGFIQRRIEMCANAAAIAEDLVTIVNYSSTAQVMCKGIDINKNPETHTKFRSGGTDFGVGLELVMGEMKNLQADYQPVLVFMSDGGSGTGDAEIKKISEEYANRNIDIFLIGFGSGCNETKLKTMEKISGGKYYFGANGSTES